MSENYILDFNGDYEDYPNFTHFNCSQVLGSRLICSDEAREKLNQLIAHHGISGVHFLDSGDYHYITKLMCDQIHEPFDLVLFDHHTDMKDSVFGEMLTCGDWVRNCIEENSRLHQVIVAGPSQKAFQQVDFHSQKLKAITEEDFMSHKAMAKLAYYQSDLPLYLSVDKDILTKKDAVTNWNQGQLDISTLQQSLRQVLSHQRLIGADICGMPEECPSLAEQLKAEQINRQSDEKIAKIIQPYLKVS